MSYFPLLNVSKSRIILVLFLIFQLHGVFSFPTPPNSVKGGKASRNAAVSSESVSSDTFKITKEGPEMGGKVRNPTNNKSIDNGKQARKKNSKVSGEKIKIEETSYGEFDPKKFAKALGLEPGRGPSPPKKPPKTVIGRFLARLASMFKKFGKNWCNLCNRFHGDAVSRPGRTFFRANLFVGWKTIFIWIPLLFH